MKSILYLSLLLCLIACQDKEQPTVNTDADKFKTLIELPNSINESSGLLLANSTSIYTHNDSGNDPIISRVDIASGDILAETPILSENNDWEELAEDDSHIYIGDFGNNNGDRTDLNIIKVAKANVEVPDTQPVTTEKINFSFPEQTDFSPRPKHNFDCEAMISFGDHLYLFTKNRDDRKTDLYRLPKVAGTYDAEHLTTFNSRGLITAATMRKTDEPAIALLGYQQADNGFAPFIWLLYDFTTPDFFTGKTQRIEVPYQVQAEAISFENNVDLLFTAEEEVGQAGLIYRFKAGKWLR